MRITGGVHGSRKLESPKGDAVRPTSDKVRLAVFNMLGARGVLGEAVVIDAFCGTGALGLEALSRGANFCYFFDKSKDSYKLTQGNIVVLKEQARSTVSMMDITKVKTRPEKDDPATLVFLDPPYHQNLIGAAVEALHQKGWLADEVLFVMETDIREKIESSLVTIESEKIYGDTKISIGSISTGKPQS